MAEVDWLRIHACDKQTREIVTNLSKLERSYLRYRYFVDFQHGISLFANFSYGIAVLGTPQCPPPKECRLHAKKAGLHLNWCAAVEIEIRAACSIMESIKAFWKTRAYSRIFIDNIGNQGFSPEIIYYKVKSSEKRKGKNHFPLLQCIKNLH